MANERTLCCFQANPRESLGKLLERMKFFSSASITTSPTINVGKMQELTQEQIESFPTNDYLLVLDNASLQIEFQILAVFLKIKGS